MEAQVRLFKIVKSKIGNKRRLSNFIEELLNISTDVAFHL